MILLDNNQIILANMFSNLKQDPVINEDLLRHLVLNSYRTFRQRFGEDFGELIICQDSSPSWRKQLYPEYKANRAKIKDKSPYDWKEIYRILDLLREEIRENFPYKDMRVEGAEADDIIATLTRYYHQTENILIISNDKDFQQLQAYPQVLQFSTIKKEMMICDNPYNFLVEHIIRGDTSDGIPNILSDDDTFINDNKRQKRMTEKMLLEISKQVPSIQSTVHARNWDRNSTLIDFTKIPENLENDIIEEYKKSKVISDRSKVLPYMMNHRLKNLISSVEEF